MLYVPEYHVLAYLYLISMQSPFIFFQLAHWDCKDELKYLNDVTNVVTNLIICKIWLYNDNIKYYIHFKLKNKNIIVQNVKFKYLIHLQVNNLQICCRAKKIQPAPA